jgi:hypothetical protein
MRIVAGVNADQEGLIVDVAPNQPFLYPQHGRRGPFHRQLSPGASSTSWCIYYICQMMTRAVNHNADVGVCVGDFLVYILYMSDDDKSRKP